MCPTPRRGRRVDRGGRHARYRADRGRDPDRRDLQRARRGDPHARSSAGSRTRRVAIKGRGLDLNDALGNLGPFITDASDILDDPQPPEGARCKGLVRDTGDGLRGAHRAATRSSPARSSARTTTFGALASRTQRSPRSSRSCRPSSARRALTLDRLDEFQANTRPLVQDLKPVARDLSPTLRIGARALAEPAQTSSSTSTPLSRLATKGLPALRELPRRAARRCSTRSTRSSPTSTRSSATSTSTRTNVTDFLAGPAVGLAGTPRAGAGPAGAAPRPAPALLPQPGEPLDLPAAALPTNRGNGYLAARRARQLHRCRDGIFPNFDCKNTDYSPASQNPDEDRS